MTHKPKTRQARSGERCASRVGSRPRLFTARFKALPVGGMCTLSIGRLAVLLVLALTACFAVGTGSALAATEPVGPPRFLNPNPELEPANIGATRVLVLPNVSPGGLETSVHYEYAESEAGPWITVGLESVPAGNGNRTDQFLIHHLTPKTPYYLRVVAKNSMGEAVKTATFTTLPVRTPSVVDVGGGGGVTYAELNAAEVNGEGAETEYSFEYAESKTGPWLVVPGSSSTITVAESFAKPEVRLTGLTAEKTYYVRVKATNVEGTTTNFINSLDENEVASNELAYYEFTTLPAHPKVFSPWVKVTGASAHIEDTVQADETETEWRVEYATSPDGSWTSAFAGTISAAEAGVGFHQVSGDLDDLSPASTYYVREFAENAHGHVTSHTASFETAGPPRATTLMTHAIDGEALRALGSVVPHGYDTHYHFEYVSAEKFAESGFSGAASTVEMDAGAGESVEDGQSAEGIYPDVLVGQDLSGLQPGSSYDYRLVAGSVAPGDPVVDGATRVLSVPATSVSGGGQACPNAAFRTGPSGGLPDCRAYEQVTPAEKGGAQDIFKYGVSAEGWLVGQDGEHVWLGAPGVQWGSSPDPSASNYTFTRSATGWQTTSLTPSSAGPDSYRPQLFNADLTEVGLEVGWETSEGVSQSAGLEFDLGSVGGPYAMVASAPRADRGEWVAASADGSKTVLRSEDHALLGFPTGTDTGYDLYEFSGGERRQVNTGIGKCGASIVDGSEGYSGRAGAAVSKVSSPHAVSADGSRVFFEAVPGTGCGAASDLYVRVDGSETVDIGEYRFLAANAEGERLLLEHDNNGTYEVFLYETSSGKFTLLMSEPERLSENGDLIVSEDLTAFYFFSGAPLTGEAPSVGSGTGLYRYDIEEHALQFVVSSATPESSGFGLNHYAVSPEGRYLYWNSAMVTDVPGGLAGSSQAYRYDSAENVVQCVSCASPYDPEPGLSALFPEDGNAQAHDGVPETSVASDDGDYVFFDTAAALVPQDVDGETPPEAKGGEEKVEHPSQLYSVSSDVYEWRKDGVDGCAAIQGCLALISSGTGGEQNVLLGATPSGRDVFFATHAQLAPTDTDTAGDIYDARIGGGFPVSTRPVECEGDACSTPLTAPIDVTPASFSFSGPGDLAPVLAPTPKAKPKARSTCKAKAKKKCQTKPKKKQAVKRAKKRNQRKGR